MSSGPPADRPGGGEPRLTLPGRFRAVIFDLDGLLIDTEPGWQRAEAELLRRHGSPYTEADAANSVGSPVWQVIDRYAARLGMDTHGRERLLAELMELARAEYGGDLQLRPGAAELLAHLVGKLPLGVASNTPRELVDAALRAGRLESRFQAVVAAEDVARPKPAPDIYLEVCRRLNVEPTGAVALEDSAPGITAARDAGLTVVAVPQFEGVDTSAAHHVAGSLRELIPVASGQ